MRAGRKQKKGIHPAVAAALLLLGVLVAGRQMFGTSWLGDSGEKVNQASANEAALPEAQGGDGHVEDAPHSRDLLVVHGSFDRSRAVRVAFRLPVDTSVAAAPAAETSPLESGRWIGEDPPALQLGVVMVSESARRAVLGGRVVGVGDEVGSSRVVSIERGVVVVWWNGRNLTYDLEDVQPREFRAELARRGSAAKDKSEAKGNQEEGK